MELRLVELIRKFKFQEGTFGQERSVAVTPAAGRFKEWMMKFVRICFVAVLLLILSACASCQLTKDAADSPASLDQDRLLMKIDGLSEVGIHGTIAGSDLYVRSYGKGSMTLRGLNECGFVTSLGVSGLGWNRIDASHLPDKEFCLYTVQSSVNGFDSPSIGHFMVRKFKDPNVLPLRTIVNKVERLGLNWVQLREDQSYNVAGFDGSSCINGICEDRDIIVFLGNHTGKLNITGCGGIHPVVIEYSNQEYIRLTIDDLFKEVGKVSDCVFTITANHDDALKESASVLVKTYKRSGSFLNAPIVNGGCFSFTDPYVVGTSVNGKWKQKSKVCVGNAKTYYVEGVTSKHRLFYGEYSDGHWVRML